MGKGTKVVIDNNVFISGFGWNGKPEEVLKLLQDDHIVNNPAAETAGRQSQNSNSLSYSKSFSPIVLSTSELRQRPQGVLIIKLKKFRTVEIVDVNEFLNIISKKNP